MHKHSRSSPSSSALRPEPPRSAQERAVTARQRERALPAPVDLAVIARGTRLTSIRYVLGVVPFEDLLDARDLGAVIGVHGEQNVAALDLSFVLLGFQFGNAIANQGPRQTSGRRADGRSAEQSHEGSSGN